MITMTVSEHRPKRGSLADGQPYADQASCVWEGQVFTARSGNGATMKLARALVTAGCPDQPWQACRNDKRQFYGNSIYQLAKLTINSGFRADRWQPRPDSLSRP
jgi:hypothetical protein